MIKIFTKRITPNSKLIKLTFIKKGWGVVIDAMVSDCKSNRRYIDLGNNIYFLCNEFIDKEEVFYLRKASSMIGSNKKIYIEVMENSVIDYQSEAPALLMIAACNNFNAEEFKIHGNYVPDGSGEKIIFYYEGEQLSK